MTMFEHIRTAFRKYADFTGRATRPQFWWFILFVTIISAAIIALAVPSNGRLFELVLSADSASFFVSFAFVWAAFILLPSLAVAVRRLNDVGRGEQELLWILVPIVGWIILTIRLCQPSSATRLNARTGSLA